LADQFASAKLWSEEERLAALARYSILDTPREPAFDDIVRLAADVFEAPIAVVNLIASGRQWFKAEVGIGADELPLDVSFCAHAILQKGLMVVADTRDDPRFVCNPLVTGEPKLRFYAGALMETPEGLPIGTVCVLDTKPRPEGITARQRLTLEVLARQAMTHMELRRAVALRDEALVERSATEDALRTHSLLLERMSEGVSLSDENGVIVYTNRAEDLMFGYEPGELVGQHVSVQNAYPPEENQRIVEEVIGRLKSEGRWDGEFLNRRKDGSTFVTASRITALQIGERPHWLCVQRDVTHEMVTVDRERFLSVLSDRMRAAPDPITTSVIAGQALGEHLGAARAGYGEIDETGEIVRVQRDWTKANTPSLAGEARLLDAFGPAIIAELRAGRTLVVEDFETDHRAGPEYASTWESIGTRSMIVVPLIRRERLQAVLYVHEPVSRRWTTEEKTLAKAVADRTWSAVEQARAEAQLRETSRRLDAVLNNASVSIFLMNEHQECVYMNAAAERLTGYSLSEAMNRILHDVIHHKKPDGSDYPLHECPIDRAFPEDNNVQGEELFVHKDGSFYPVAFTASPIRDETSRTIGTIIEVRNIADEKRARAHQRLLIDELNHRAKNLLAIIQGIALQTFKNVPGAEGARAAFDGRLAALAEAHNLLTRQNWESAPLTQVVAGAVSPYEGTPRRFDISGPELALPPKTAVSLALALHELATNASKYGALSVVGGRVEVRWDVAEDRLRLHWREHDGPPVEVPATRGFGTRMLERGLAAELGGSVRIDFRPAGVVCSIEAPVEGLRP
jgi:PAS domain S-box-containing protein